MSTAEVTKGGHSPLTPVTIAILRVFGLAALLSAILISGKGLAEQASVGRDSNA